MRQLTFSGTPQEIGQAFGESCRDPIAELYALRVKNALAQAKEYGGRAVDESALLRLSERCLPVSERYDPDGFAELLGIARGARMTAAQIFAMNGLTDLRDVLAFGEMRAWAEEGCSSFIITGERTRDGKILIGQTWDLATDNMPFVVAVHRKPNGRPETWSLTTVGCLSLIGMNAEGLAIGTTNLRTTDSRIGVCYLQIIHRALSRSTLDDAERAIVDAPRAGAHYYYGADARGGAIAIECTATKSQALAMSSGGYFVHCNHVLAEAQRSLEASTPMKSSLCRQARMGALIAGARDKIDVETAKRFLADHDGGTEAICRHDYACISSNGSIIIQPETRSVWACHGPACTATWVELTLA